jgi:hypothetical protein
MTRLRWGAVLVMLLLAGCGSGPIGAPAQPTSGTVQVGGPTGGGATQPQGCEAEPDSPIDIASEPAHWLNFGEYFRWFDGNGCPVRIDVISHTAGAEHCQWQAVEFITIGRPLGEAVDQLSPATANRYIWNPDGVIPGIAEATEISRSDLPDGAIDTGYDQFQVSMWIDPADESVLYLVSEDTAQMWIRDFEAGLCS